jgi:hypothetical protein
MLDVNAAGAYQRVASGKRRLVVAAEHNFGTPWLAAVRLAAPYLIACSWVAYVGFVAYGLLVEVGGVAGQAPRATRQCSHQRRSRHCQQVRERSSMPGIC